DAIDGLVERLGAAEADGAIEADGGRVLGRHLEVGAAESGLVEAFEGLADQGPAQPQAAVRGDHAQVLDRANRAAVHHALDGAAGSRGAADQPGRRGQEARLAADLAHQALAAGAVAQAREDVRVDLTPETQELDLGVLIDERLLPGDPVKRRRQTGRGQRAPPTDLHTKTRVIPDRPLAA